MRYRFGWLFQTLNLRLTSVFAPAGFPADLLLAAAPAAERSLIFYYVRWRLHQPLFTVTALTVSEDPPMATALPGLFTSCTQLDGDIK
jgi:hypothetical protein